MTASSEASPRRGRGGRRGARGGASAAIAAPAYITRKINWFDLLDEEQLDLIEQNADRFLEEFGLEFRENPEALALWKEAGADVTGELVRFPKGLVRKLMETAPAQFTQYARNPARNVEIGGKHLVFAPAYGPPFTAALDIERRYSNIEDFQNFVKLAYMTPWLHHSGGTVCEPVDIPVNKRHLDMVYAHLKYSDKPFMGSVTAPERAVDSIDMARLAFGEQFVDQNAVVLALINMNSPRVFDGVMSSVAMEYAKANQPTIVTPFLLGGAMGPVTLAGVLAQAHAEAMVGVAFTQLVRPGAPVIYGNFFSSLSLKTGAPTFGMPEPQLGYHIIGQLARRVKVPLRCGGSLTASKINDVQSSQESVDSLLPAVQSGANFMLHSAGWLEGGLVMGYEKFILDSEHLMMMHRYCNGIDLDENGFAMDAFQEVAPGGHFLGCAHTMRNYETAYVNPELADNNSFEQWRDDGKIDIVTKANAKWKKMLAEYQAPELDASIDDALLGFIARKKESMADAWY